jgi:hypothetical protein
LRMANQMLKEARELRSKSRKAEIDDDFFE